jgi:hypothetical protein
MKLNYLYSSIVTIGILSNSYLPALAQISEYSNSSEVLISESNNNIPGKAVFDVYDMSKGSGIITNYSGENPNVPRQDNLGYSITGQKNIEQLSENQLFSVLILQDGFVRLAILQPGQKSKIRYIGKDYLFKKLIKVGERRYILNSQRDPNEGGDNYYDVDLRNISKPNIKKIDLATVQRLSRTNSNQKLSNSNSRSTNQCQSAIKQAKATITKGRKITVNIQTSSFGEEYKTYPPEYSIGYTIRLSGLATESVMNSTQFMNIISQRIINNCQSVGLVNFIQDQSDWVIRFGSINGEVKQFKCVDPNQDKVDWGAYFCL